MTSINLSNLSTLPVQHKTALERGGIYTVEKLLLTSPQDVARKCRLSPIEIRTIVDTVCIECNRFSLRFLEDIVEEGNEIFSTGDQLIDSALGGGIRTGMIWEIVGESAAGKTQFALQLSLFVQLAPQLGGLDGSCCYLTTSSKLPTERILQIRQNHEALLSTDCSLSHVHTIATPSIPVMLRVLSQILPDFVHKQSRTTDAKSVKLIVIDALAELFHDNERTTTATLVERSRSVAEIGSMLHTLAAEHQVAVVVLNEVVDVFDRGQCYSDDMELAYNRLSRWFARGDSVPGEDGKEASLGLVWANQVNARIQLSRTGRRRYVTDHTKNQSKARRTGSTRSLIPGVSINEPPQENDQSTLIRRFNVIFNSVSPTVSLDYIVTGSGISSLPNSVTYPLAEGMDEGQSDFTSLFVDIVGDVEAGSGLVAPKQAVESESPAEPGDEWDKIWDDDISIDVYTSFAECQRTQ